MLDGIGPNPAYLTIAYSETHSEPFRRRRGEHETAEHLSGSINLTHPSSAPFDIRFRRFAPPTRAINA
ncbi:MAG TPA: hypothetical protein VIK27_06040 [Candidatus Aquilonibacter sp.]